MRILLAIFGLFSLLQWSGETEVRAAFALVGTTITQTGTDTDLSGLAGIAGVTVSTQADIDVYNIGDRRLVIQGTLTIDPEIETLIVGYNNGDLIQVTGTGHLIIGQEIVQNGFSRYSEGLAIYLENTPSGFTNRVSFSGNSSFTWNGGLISMYAGKFGFYGDNVTVRINSTNARLIYRTQDPQNQIRQETDDFISTGFAFINGDLTIVGTGQQLNGYEPTHATGAIAFSGATPNVDVTLRGYAGGDRGNEKDIKLWAGGRPVLINSKTGSQLNVGAHIDGNRTSYGVARVFQELDLQTIDLSNTPIEDATIYIRDTNNGNRETYTREAPNIDFSADNVYIASTDSAGNIPTQQVLLAANVANNGNGDAPNTGNYAWDYRGKNNDDSDLYDIHVWSYSHLYQLLPDTELKGADGTSIVTKMLPDSAVTEPDRSVVAAYTGITVNHATDTITIGAGESYTVRDLYDYVKYDKTLSANIEEPSIDTTAITSPDGRNFTSTYNIIVDGTLVQDPELESLTFDASVTDEALVFRNGSVHELGQVIIEGGVTRVSVGTALVTEFAGNSNFNDPSLRYESGSTLNWNGGKMELAGTTYYDSGSTININQGEHEITNSGQLIRSFTTGLTINQFDLRGGALIFAEQPTSVVGFVPSLAILSEAGRNDYAALIYGSDTGNGTANTVTLENFEGIGNPNDIGFIDGSRFVLLNPNDGTGVSILPWLQNSNRSDAYGTIEKDIEVNVSDSSGTAIQNAKVYIQDYNNGNRENQQGFDDTADKIYETLTDVNGQVTDRIITAIINEVNNNGLAPLTYDLRSKNNDNTDTFDIHKWAYNYDYGVSTQTLVGKDTLVVDWTLFRDNAITETNRATVDGYTTIGTLDRLYDRAKSYKIDNIAYPAIAWQVIDAVGTQLDLGSKNLVVDGAAGAAFDVNQGTNTITINAATMNCTGGNFTSLVTTGTVSFVNGASPGTCIFTDSVGTNGVLTLTGVDQANVLVYDDVAPGDDTITYQTNVSGTVAIPFNATSSTDFQVVVRRQGYSEQNFEFNPSGGGFFEFPISQFRSLTIEGAPIYSNTGDLAKVTMDFPGLRINIGDFTIPIQEFYDTLQDYEVTETGMKSPRIANYDGGDKLLLLNAYQMRSRDGSGTVPGVNGFIFAGTGTVLDPSNGTVQYLVNDSATVDRQEQIIKMLEGIQGSTWNNTTEEYAVTFGNLVDIAGPGFNPLTDSLSNLVQSMLDDGITDVNTMKDLVR